MFKEIRNAVYFFLFVIVFSVAHGGAFAQQAAGYNGWGTHVPGGSVSGFSSADAACQHQFQAFTNGIGTYNGIYDFEFPIAKCSWDHPFLNPAYVSFSCASGFEEVGPGSCIREDLLKDIHPVSNGMCPVKKDAGQPGNSTPVNPLLFRTNETAGNPIEILSGRKLETALDFTTHDGLLYVQRQYTSRRAAPADYLENGALRFGGIGWSFDFGPQVIFDENFSSSKSLHIYLPSGPYFSFAYNQVKGKFTYRGPTPAWSDKATEDRFAVEIDGGTPTDWGIVNTQVTNWTITDRHEGIEYKVSSRLRPGETDYRRGHVDQIIWRSGYKWIFSYGTDAEPVTLADSFGRQLSFNWLTGWGGTDTDHNILIESIVLPDGRALKYEYLAAYPNGATTPRENDVVSKVEHVHDVNGSGTQNLIAQTVYHYEDQRFPHHLTGITDNKGVRYSTWTYDEFGRAITSDHASGSQSYAIAFTEPSNNVNVQTVTNPLGKDAIYTYNSNLLGSVDGQASQNCVASQRTITNSLSLPREITDEEGRKTRYYRDDGGLPSRIVYARNTADERTIWYTWRDDRQIEEVKEPGLTTNYSYDAQGRLIVVSRTDTTAHNVPYSTNGQQRSWTYTYTNDGLLASVDGPLAGAGDTVSFTYDSSGYLATTTNELGHVTTVNSVDGLGRPLLVTDVNGVQISMSYTDLGDVAQFVIDPAGRNVATNLTYDAIGQVTSISRNDGSVYTYAYDDGRRLTSITDALGSKLEFTHNGMDQVTQTQIKDDQSNILYAQSRVFDELGRVISSVGASNQSWSYAYDRVSNLVSVTDPRNGATGYAYDNLDQLIQQVDQISNSIAFGRDDRGNLSAHTDQRSVVTNFVHNGFGEVIQESSPDIGTIIYQRDGAGNITQRTDARGVVTNYVYDAASRLLSVSYPASGAEDVSFTYDDTSSGNLGVGRLTGIVDQSGTTSITYNSLGLVASKMLVSSGHSWTTEYDYDSAGNLQHVTYPSGRIVSYWRDGFGEINSVSTNKNAQAPLEDIVLNINWQPFAGVQSLDFGTGLNLWHTFDQDYRYDQRALFDGQTAVSQQFHTYTDDLNLTNIWDNLNAANNQSFWYDARNMLQNADGPWGSDNYFYDDVGNRNWQDRTVGGNTTSTQTFYETTSNRILDIDIDGVMFRNFVHDAAGNLTTETKNGVTRSFSYNNANRMSSFSVGGTPTGAYIYNAAGQLVIRQVSNNVPSFHTAYIYDESGQVIAEYDVTSGNVLREYLWLGDMPIAVIDDGQGVNPETYYVHTDHLNRPVAMSDGTKAFVAQYIWDPYGNVHSETGTQSVALRFPGQQFHAETGLHYNWHRMYDPSTGRYTQADPLGLIDGPARYAYVTNDPLQKIDPNGLQKCSGGVCENGGSFGSSGMFLIPGRGLMCRDCAIKHFALQDECEAKIVEILRPFEY